jgi:hypothetical protein
VSRHHAFRLLIVLTMGAACSSTLSDSVASAPDVTTPVDTAIPADVSVRDAAIVDVAPRLDAMSADVRDVLVDDNPAPPGPIDGTWRVRDITCNGSPASDAARLFITAPNSSTFVVHGDRSTYTLVTSTCTLRLESSVRYPAPGRAVFTATSPFACTPARCALGCDTTPSLPYVYDYVAGDASLMMTTVGPTPDVTCTAYGQSNPIRYIYQALP